MVYNHAKFHACIRNSTIRPNLALSRLAIHGKALPDFYIVISFFHKKSKQARVPTIVWLVRDDSTTANGPGCDEGTNLRLRDFTVVPLMPTLDLGITSR